MKIIEYSYHEMRRVWSNGEAAYLNRTEEEFRKLFEPIRAAFDKAPNIAELSDFLRPYVWRPKAPGIVPVDEKALKALAERMEGEASLWLTAKYFDPISKYGEQFEGPTFEYNGSDLVDEFWMQLQGTGKRGFPPIASVSLTLE